MNFLRAGLSGKLRPVRLSVIENIPVSVNQLDSPMGVAQMVERILFLPSIQENAPNADNRPAVTVPAIRPVACAVT